MKIIKSNLLLSIFALGLFVHGNAFAGIPVIDGANLAQSVLQVVAWAQQAEDMANQIESMENQLNQAKQQFNSLNGARSWGNLVNNPASWKYLPDDPQNIYDGYGNSGTIMSGNSRMNYSDTWLDPYAQDAQDYKKDAQRAAVNKATAQASYKKASARTDNIQLLVDKINTASDAKDIADLQARIQGEQAMLENEKIKLDRLDQLASAEKDLQNQRDRDKCTAIYRDSTIPNW